MCALDSSLSTGREGEKCPEHDAIGRMVRLHILGRMVNGGITGDPLLFDIGKELTELERNPAVGHKILDAPQVCLKALFAGFDCC
jgi:hypothetical protein